MTLEFHVYPHCDELYWKRLTKRKRIMEVIPELRSPEEKLHFCNNQSIYGIRLVTLTNPSLYSLTTLKCSKTIC